MNLFWTHGKTP